MVDYDIRNSLGYDITLNQFKKKHWDFWEAFPVGAGEGGGEKTEAPGEEQPSESVRGGKLGPDLPFPKWILPTDNYGDPDAGRGTQGRSDTRGDAKFYEGLTKLPAEFIGNNPDTLAMESPSTTTDPGFPEGTPNVDHDLSVEWSCRLLKGKTVILSHTP